MSEEIPEILSAYLDGELSPAEMLRVEQELESNPALQAQLAVLRKYQWQIQALPLITPPVNFLDKISLQFEQSVLESNTTRAVQPFVKQLVEIPQTTTSTSKAKLNLSRWASICSCVCAVVMVVGLSYWSLNSVKSNSDMDFTYNKMSRPEAVATISSSARDDFDVKAVPPPTAGAAMMADSIPADTAPQASNAPVNQAGLLAPNYVVTWENEHAIYLSDTPKNKQQSMQHDEHQTGEKQPGNDISMANTALAYNKLNLTQIGNRGITVSNNEYALRFVMSDVDDASKASMAYKKGDDQSAKYTVDEKQDLSVAAKDSTTVKNNMPELRNSYGSSKESPALPAEQNMAIAQDATQSQNTHSPQTYFNTLINVEAPEDHILVLKVNLDGDAAQLQELEQILTRNDIISTADGLVSKSAAQNQQPGDKVPNAATFAASESQTNAEPQKSINKLPKTKIEKSAENLTAQALPETETAGELNQTMLASQGVYLDATTVQLEQTFNELLAHKTVREMEVSLAYVPTGIPPSQESSPSPSVRVEPRSARTMSTGDDRESVNKNSPAEKEHQPQKARLAEEANSKVAPKTNLGRNGNKELKSKQNVEDQPAHFNNQDRKPCQQAKTGAVNQTRVDVFRGQANNRGYTQATPQHSVDESKNAPFQDNQTTMQPLPEPNATGYFAPINDTKRQEVDNKKLEEKFIAKPHAETVSDQQRHQVYPQTPSKQTQIGQNINGRKVLIFFERRAPITGNQRHIPPAPAVPEK